jgi:hypothetical protein
MVLAEPEEMRSLPGEAATLFLLQNPYVSTPTLPTRVQDSIDID